MYVCHMSVLSKNFVTKVEKWEHPCCMDKFLFFSAKNINLFPWQKKISVISYVDYIISGKLKKNGQKAT